MSDWYARVREHKRVLDDPATPDSMEVRKALLAQVECGQITLEEAQKIIRKLRRKRERQRP